MPYDTLDTMSNTLSDISIKTVREQRGLSQAKAARLVGSTQPQMSRIEHGTELPSLPIAASLAAIYGVPVEQLFPSLFAHMRRQTERRWRRFARLWRPQYDPILNSFTALAVYPSIRRIGHAVFAAPASA